MDVHNAAAGDPYWFQQGAIGRKTPVCDTCSSVGASVSIRTVYDKVNNDAHSYWVGAILANGAFVQVGYINGLTTTNEYYCCAWFYEYFPSGDTTSPPFIGPIGSAGPIWSWHTYTMNYNASAGVGVWSFYMDNQYLGSSPTSGQQYYLGAGATNTGSNPVAALSEVASTIVNTDVIGPAEFKNLMYETSPNSLGPVPDGQVHWGYGVTSWTNLSNPYSVAEVVGVPNDFITGSDVPYPGPSSPGVDECGNSVSNGAILWPGTLCGSGSTTSLSFNDMDGSSIIPPWISLTDSAGTRIFYTDYQSYQSITVPSPSGQWTIDQISWHSVNVANPVVVNMSVNNPIPTRVFSVKLSVVGYFYSIPVKNATVILILPDSTNQTMKTDVNGEAVFSQLPPSTYNLRIGVPYGITSNQAKTISGPGSLVARVFSLPELITIIVPPILIAIIAAAAAVRNEHRRQAMMQSQAVPGLPTGPAFCRSCGHPLSAGMNFCTNCGTPTRTMIQ